jgi:integrase
LSTPFHSWAAALTLRGPSGAIESLTRSIANSRVDLNPHQVDAALFAIRSPLTKGVLLADELGLGKTVEAGIVITQRWAERRRKILLILPATLRKQWQQELTEKFSLPSVILEGRTASLRQPDHIAICSYHFAAGRGDDVKQIPWDLVVVDEAHRLRNVWKTSSKIAQAISEAISHAPKVLLTATPLQNSLIELYEQRIVPQWGNRRLCEINPDEVQQWLFETCDSWHMMNDLRGIMSGIYTKAEEWGYWPEGRRNPISRVKIGEKWSVRPEKFLTEEETVRVLARLRDPNLLIIETAIGTGARISEILGLQWRHVDLVRGIIHILQRNWRGDIDDPKSKTSKRLLTLGYLVERYRVKAIADGAAPEKWVFVRDDGSGLTLWDSGVRQALKRAAAAEGCDFPGLGPHSFRRYNITTRQEVGGSSIEASKIAGHSTVRMTEEYTKIQLTRQEELTRLIQDRLASVGQKQPATVQ